jgi:hypothetical protein
MPEVSNLSSSPEILRFLYDKRFEHFNVRREHEWKIVFGLLILLGTVDATLLSKSVCLSPCYKIIWSIGVVLLGVATIAYELGIQARNRIDRIVMDHIQQALCESTGILKENICVCVDSTNKRYLEKTDLKLTSITYLWAFWSQVLVLVLACTLSCFVPMIVCKLPH